jgi:hypothetical protein
MPWCRLSRKSIEAEQMARLRETDSSSVGLPAERRSNVFLYWISPRSGGLLPGDLAGTRRLRLQAVPKRINRSL